MTFHVPEQYRITSAHHPLGSSPDHGNNGAFLIRNRRRNATLRVIASDGEGWEHVSVSTSSRCPTWDEMCQIKALFWDADDCVVQFHPPMTRYVDMHPFTLHLWRRIGDEWPMPEMALI